MRFEVLTEGVGESLEAEPDASGRLMAAVEAPVLGWRRRAHGWCRGDACVPSARAAQLEEDGRIDVVAFAEMLGDAVAVDIGAGLVATVPTPPPGSGTGEAPDFTLTGLDGVPYRLSDFRGRKVALVIWASWCGCRYDLPAWEARHRELAGHGFTVVSVALDHALDDARPWIEEAAPAHPALVDLDGVVAARYDVVNVPTAVWIDEDGRVARPQDTQVATDLFQSLNGLSADASLAALRRWVTRGDTGIGDERRGLRVPTDREQRARAHARLAVALAERGDADRAAHHRRRAAELAPRDVAIRRGLMGLLGEDPFGEAYFALRDELTAAGVPIYRPLGADTADA